MTIREALGELLARTDVLLHRTGDLLISTAEVMGPAAASFAGSPAAIWAVTIATAALVIAVTIRRRPRSAPTTTRPTSGRATVQELARRGLTLSEIARQTGLAHDAVGTILRTGSMQAIPTPASDRKSRPHPARSSAPPPVFRRLLRAGRHA